jgi:hypothetical protein
LAARSAGCAKAVDSTGTTDLLAGGDVVGPEFDAGRRSVLARGLRCGAALGGVTVGRGRVGSVLRALTTEPGSSLGVVRTEPGAPPDHLSFVTRPDLTPPGVTVRAAEGFARSGLQASYFFCAPKAPAAANPGSLPTRPKNFPSGAVPGLMILDVSGNLVWFKPSPETNAVPFNFRVQRYRGRPTLTWFEGTVKHGHAVAGRYLLADDSYQRIGEVRATDYPCDLHEFILTPEGTALHTAYEQRVESGGHPSLIVGHAQEVDVATNDLLFDWPCYPSVRPELSYVDDEDGYGGDYFHINSIDLWPGSARNLLISSRNTCALYLVDRHTKQVIWRLGGKRSDFAMGRGTRFYYQHDARALPDGSGLSVFDDASQPCPERYASGKVLNLDQQNRQVTLRHCYFHTDGEFATPSQGNCQVLPNSAHVVGWGYLPFFSVYGSSGDAVEAPLVLDGRFPEGADSYRTLLFEWTGHPSLDELGFVVRRGAGSGNFTGWASWNGATEVASWQLRGGRSGSALGTIATVAKQGFETAFDFVSDSATVFQVDALDASGSVIGRSDLVSSL